ncbi:MAG: toll/interleukin-1 receptor domain-containing protein [Bryobacterales bacterium]|nr:toll/interleukin-1 receptor domain-containing protein [Bryobacterales bacterium]
MISLDEEDLRELLFPGGAPTILEEKLAALLGETLGHGEPVHLEGIGIVSLDNQRKLHIAPSPRPRVFLAYAVEDLPRVRTIYRFLKARSFEPWMDVECLLPGQNWPRAIERAIESADFVVPCFSKVSASKRGYFQAELRIALECARLRPMDESFLAPVRLEPCQLPWSIQRQTQYVDLFPEPAPGLRKLLKTLRGKQIPTAGPLP